VSRLGKVPLKNTKTIKVEASVHNELSKIGRFNERFSDIIARLINEHKEHTNREKQEEVKKYD